jgi:hypothetical protein
MTRWVGRYLLGVGAFHNVVGVLLFSRPLGAIAAAGGWNAVGPHVDRNMAFWFLIAGLTFMLLGALVDWMEAQRLALPRRLGWGLLGLAALGAFCMPVSGFWLFVPAALATLRRSAPALPTVIAPAA